MGEERRREACIAPRESSCPEVEFPPGEESLCGSLRPRGTVGTLQPSPALPILLPEFSGRTPSAQALNESPAEAFFFHGFREAFRHPTLQPNVSEERLQPSSQGTPHLCPTRTPPSPTLRRQLPTDPPDVWTGRPGRDACPRLPGARSSPLAGLPSRGRMGRLTAQRENLSRLNAHECHKPQISLRM